ncbi:hypothetical protein LINPERPRIM_LOCUS13248 [Linum perenne]
MVFILMLKLKLTLMLSHE